MKLHFCFIRQGLGLGLSPSPQSRVLSHDRNTYETVRAFIILVYNVITLQLYICGFVLKHARGEKPTHILYVCCALWRIVLGRAPVVTYNQVTILFTHGVNITPLFKMAWDCVLCLTRGFLTYT